MADDPERGKGRDEKMETQSIIDLIGGAILAILGWIGNQLWEAVKELRADLRKIEADLPKSYVGKEDYREDMHDIKGMLSKIVDKLDGKVDR